MAALAPPKIGDIQNAHKYIGGDPADDASWQLLSGKDYLATIPAARASIVQGVLQGRAPFPNSRASKPDAFSNQILQDVALTEPGFDATRYKQRQDLIKEFSSGKTANVIRALNQGAGHLKSMSENYDQLHNSGYEWMNAIKNTVLPAIGDQDKQGALGAAASTREALAPELATIYRGGQSAEADVEGQRKGLSPNVAPAYSNAHLAQNVDLMHSRLNSLQEQWRKTMGPLAGDYPILDPEARKAYTSLVSRYQPALAKAQQTGDMLWSPTQDTPVTAPQRPQVPIPQALPRLPAQTGGWGIQKVQ